jgi:hypothetical protein
MDMRNTPKPIPDGKVLAFFAYHIIPVPQAMLTKRVSCEQEYIRYVEKHRKIGSGERRKRLEEGVGHGEKLFLETIWWVGFGHFNHLHPEYEFVGEKGRTRFIDFSFIYSWFKIAFEILGFGPHLKQMSRWSYSDEQQRIRSLSAAG